MSISQALNTSLSGLRATQAGLSLIASNVANAQTPGYVRKTLSLVTSAAGDAGGSVRVGAVNRELDQYLQRQLRVESAGGAYADLRADFYQRLQGLYGDPGLGQRARDRVQQLHQLGAIAGDQPGFDGGAQPRAQQRPGAGADAERHSPPTSSRCAATPRAAWPMRSRPPTTR